MRCGLHRTNPKRNERWVDLPTPAHSIRSSCRNGSAKDSPANADERRRRGDQRTSGRARRNAVLHETQSSRSIHVHEPPRLVSFGQRPPLRRAHPPRGRTPGRRWGRGGRGEAAHAHPAPVRRPCVSVWRSPRCPVSVLSPLLSSLLWQVLAEGQGSNATGRDTTKTKEEEHDTHTAQTRDTPACPKDLLASRPLLLWLLLLLLHGRGAGWLLLPAYRPRHSHHTSCTQDTHRLPPLPLVPSCLSVPFPSPPLPLLSFVASPVPLFPLRHPKRRLGRFIRPSHRK
jgi:hypothetical protein